MLCCFFVDGPLQLTAERIAGVSRILHQAEYLPNYHHKVENNEKFNQRSGFG